MKVRHIFFSGCTAMLLTGTAFAGPCTTAAKDAGSGPTPGALAQTSTTGNAVSHKQTHPATSSMNKASDNVATSSQDAQRQTQGQPTSGQEAQGAKAKTGDDC
jgi:hypothetical protein